MAIDALPVRPLHDHLTSIAPEVRSELCVNDLRERGEIQLHLGKPREGAIRRTMVGKVDVLAVEDGLAHLIEVENSSTPKTVLRDVAEVIAARYVRIPKEQDPLLRNRELTESRGIVVVTSALDPVALKLTKMFDRMIRSHHQGSVVVQAISLVTFEDAMTCLSLADLFPRDRPGRATS